MSDALGTCLGACLGTSTVTSYVESTTGVAEGGRTGLTALTSAILFILAIPLLSDFPCYSFICNSSCTRICRSSYD